jgi:hypothetical protein
MNVFDLRKDIIARYNTYVSSFFRIRDEKVKSKVDQVANAATRCFQQLEQQHHALGPRASRDDLSRSIFNILFVTHLHVSAKGAWPL